MKEFPIQFEYNGQKHTALIWKFVTLPDGIVQFHLLEVNPLPAGVSEITFFIANAQSTNFTFKSTPQTQPFLASALHAIIAHCTKNGIELFSR